MGDMVPVLAGLSVAGMGCPYERAAREHMLFSNARTVRAYLGAWERYSGWCALRGVPVDDGGSLRLWLSHRVSSGVTRGTFGVDYHGVLKVLRLGGCDLGDWRMREFVSGLRKLCGFGEGSPAMTMGELGRLLSSSEDERMRLFLLMGFGGGFRMGELLGLHVGEVEVLSGGLHVHLSESKGDRRGEGADVWAMDFGGWSLSGSFVSVCSGLGPWCPVFGWSESGLRRRWRRLLSLSGLSGLTPHSLRVGCATRCVEGGLSMGDLGKHLRHGSLSVTAAYYRVRDGEALGRKVAGALS